LTSDKAAVIIINEGAMENRRENGRSIGRKKRELRDSALEAVVGAQPAAPAEADFVRRRTKWLN